MDSKFSHAIVIGAGAAGLACASALSEVCQKVTVIEKDSEPDGIRARKGTAQGGHLHSLLLGGLRLLETFYPGIKERLIAAGAVTFPAGLNQHIYESLRWLPSRQLDLEIVSQSRPLLEYTVLKEAKKIDNVDWLYNTKVSNLHIEDNRVVGVSLVNNGKEKLLMAPIVVDASGMGAVFVKRLSKSIEDINNP